MLKTPAGQTDVVKVAALRRAQFAWRVGIVSRIAFAGKTAFSAAAALILAVLVLVSASIAIAPGASLAATTPAVFDSSFGGGDGAVFFRPTAKSGKLHVLSDMEIDHRGRILLAYQVVDFDRRKSEPFVWAVRRLRPNGTVDRGFGRAGVATIEVPVPRTLGWLWEAVQPSELAVGPRDEVVLAGDVFRGRDRAFSAYIGVARFTSRGRPDRHFGGDGFVRMRGLPGTHRDVSQLIVQRTGRIVVAAYFSGAGATVLLRINRNGSRDRSFGGRRNATVVAKGPAGVYPATDVAQLPGGGLAVAAVLKTARKGGSLYWRIAHYSAAGKLDRAFGRNGYVTLTDAGPAHDFAVSGTMWMKVAADGTHFLLGDVAAEGAGMPGGRLGILKLDSEGSIEQDYGTNGWSAEWLRGTSNGESPDTRFAVGRGGEVFLSEHSASSPDGCPGFSVARLDSMGRPGPPAGEQGGSCTPWSGWDPPIPGPSAIAVDRFGRAVIAGRAHWINGRDVDATIFVARLRTAGARQPGDGV